MSGHQHIFEDVTHTHSTYSHESAARVYLLSWEFVFNLIFLPSHLMLIFLKDDAESGAMTMLGDQIRINLRLISNNVKINLHTLA